MGELREIPFAEESPQIKDRVSAYWNERAESFFAQRCREIESNKAARWREEILALAPVPAGSALSSETQAPAGERPAGGALNILDIGCGAGFFEVLFGTMGHRVTGIDLSKSMVEKAGEMIRRYQVSGNAAVLQMDAEHPDLPAERFDLIITRNLTWTLPHPIEAYEAWKTLLRPGGVLLNFDAEYAKGAHRLNSPENQAHRQISDRLKEECHEIYHLLSISTLSRPDWDLRVLQELGYEAVSADLSFGERIYREQDEFHIPDRMFRIYARKA